MYPLWSHSIYYVCMDVLRSSGFLDVGFREQFWQRTFRTLYMGVANVEVTPFIHIGPEPNPEPQ